MLIACVVGLCVLLFVGALVAPRLSRGPERAAHGAFGAGTRGASRAPGRFGRWLTKPFTKGNKAVGASASEGRSVRAKLPF